jgi:alpha-glucosidase
VRQTDDQAWWRDAVFYQVYVRSFVDANGDGVGDLEGVRSRLGYLELLGVDGLWLTPFYRSPMVDHGYDVSDPRDVDPLFGDLDAFDRLVADAHEHGLRVIIDLVPNHTSDQHKWFQAAVAAAPGSPERARYVSGTAPASVGRDRQTTGPAPSVARRGPGSLAAMTVEVSGTCTCSRPSSPI